MGIYRYSIVLFLGLLFYLFSYSLYGQEDGHENLISLEKCIKYEDLVKALPSLKYEQKRDQITRVYNWIIRNVEYNYRADKEINYLIQRDPSLIIEKGRAICSEYVILLNDLLTHLDIQTAEVAGYCKNCESEKGEYLTPSHVWSGVFVDSSWYMMDVTWDASLSIKKKNKENFSSKYFLKTSEEFILDHLPAMPMWQMSDSVITMKNWIKNDFFNKEKYEFDHKAEINHFLSLDKFSQSLYSDKITSAFNPSELNLNAYAQRLFDKATILVDSMDSSDLLIDYNKLKRSRKEVIRLCALAVQKASKVHDWQWEMYAGTILNEIVDIYNNEPKDNWELEDWKSLNNELKRAQFLLQKLDESFYKDSSLALCMEIQNAINSQLE